MKNSFRKRYVIIPAVILALLLLGKTFAPYLIWLPAMNISQTLFGWWPASWKEEVLLHDGSKIIVKRSQTRGGGYEIGQDVGVDKHTLFFAMPDSGKKITWQTTIGHETEDTELQPLALDIVGGIPYLVTTPMGCIAYNKWKRPNPPYVILKHVDNEWLQIPLAELPPQIKRANMVTNCFQLRQERLLSRRFGAVTSEEVNEINAQSKHKNVQYRKIFVREPFIGGERCGEFIHSKDNSWFGIDWFSDQPTYQACLDMCTRKRIHPEECPCGRFFKGDK
jgi:hypothetical protein